MNRSVAAVRVVLLDASQDVNLPTAVEVSAAPLPTAAVAADGSIPGHYIVVAQWEADAITLASDFGITPRHVYEHLLNGFSAAIPSDVVTALTADPRVI